jgi:hypothetical protein
MSTPPNSTQARGSQSGSLPESALTNTIRLLARLGREKFDGKIVISFEAGAITTLRKEETLKPADMSR